MLSPKRRPVFWLLSWEMISWFIIFRRTSKFTRRGRCISVVSREKRMRPRSECNALFGETLQANTNITLTI